METAASIVDIEVGMSPAALDALAAEVEGERIRATARVARMAHQVGCTGVHLEDGHRTVRSWLMAACNLSKVEAGRLVRIGDMLALYPSAAALAHQGRFGVAQMGMLARVVANPRVADRLAEAEELLVGHAVTLDAEDYAVFLARWEALADEDGAHQRHERAHRNRRASVHTVGERSFLEAVGGVVHGAIIQEVLDQFAQAEWWADWEEGFSIHGDDMRAGLLARTEAQRRFDALVNIFQTAATARSAGEAPAVTVNLVMGYEAFEHHLAKALGEQPAPLDPANPIHRCELPDGTPVDPRDALIAAAMGHVRRLVLDSKGAVVDLGRRQRLFTGPLREAVLLSAHVCVWPGCCQPADRCEADHMLPWGLAGPTVGWNGAPACGRHNRWRSRGYRAWRGDDGQWHHVRPDGSEIGWRGTALSAAHA